MTIRSLDERLTKKTTQGPDGQCGFHITQYQKPNPATDPYKLTLVVKELGRVYKAEGRLGTPIIVTSILPDPIEIHASNVDADPIGFSYRGTDWNTNDSGDREADCGFGCRLRPVPVCGGVQHQVVLSTRRVV